MESIADNRRFSPRTMTVIRTVSAALLLLAGLVPAAGAEVTLELALGRQRVYPGESVPVTVTLRVSAETVRNIGYPRLASPTGGQVAFSPPAQAGPGQAGATPYEFQGQLIAAKPGTVTVGPASLECEIMETSPGSAAFFGSQEPHATKLHSTAASLIVLPLPATGKPKDFSGAIGRFALSVTTVPPQVVIGEPLTVTTTIRGAGSLAAAACPVIDGATPAHPARSATQLVCEQVIIPDSTSPLPPVVWSYFSPDEGRYRVLKGNITSTVVARPAAVNARQTTSAPPPEANGRNSLLLGRSFPRLISFVLVIGILAGISGTVWKRCKPDRKKPSEEPSNEIRSLLRTAEDAVSRHDAGCFYDIAAALLQNSDEKYYSLSRKGNSPFQNGTLLSGNYAHPAFSEELRTLSAACDKVRYGRIIPDNLALSADLERLKQLFS